MGAETHGRARGAIQRADHMNQTPFQFDRPSEHGFGPRTAGEGVAAGPEALDVVADRLRDEAARNVDPLDEMTRHADPAAVRGDWA